MGDATEIIIIENESRNARLISLKEILKNYFIIPVYQRPYKWNSENFKDLLTTISDSKDQELPAFFGSIIVANKDEGKRMGKTYSLIDGQQRITSFLILLKLINGELTSLKDNIEEVFKQESDKNKMHSIIEKINKTDKLVATISRVLSTNKRLERESSSEHDNDLAREATILDYVFKDKKIQSGDVTKILDIFGEEIKEMGEGLLEYTSYVLKRSQFCFLVVKGEDSENYAIDIFNTLNSTGEALTAFEILKSLVRKKEDGQSLTNRLRMVESSLDQRMKKAIQNKYTDRLLLFISMIHKELKTDKLASFRDKKKLLDTISKEEKYERNIPKYIDSICSLHNFTIENWEKSEGKNIFNTNSEAAVCFEFLKSIRHDRTIPILFKFAESKERDKVVKACVAFTCLWRGVAADAGTDRIDNQYKTVTEALFCEDYDAGELKNNFRKCLAEKWKNSKGGNRDMTRNEWVKEFSDINIYKRIKFARFVLFVAFHKSVFDPSKHSFVKAKLKFITKENYEEYDYKSIEHIVPQSYKTINKIGNLVLLPQDINTKAGKKDFVSKRKIYQQCLEKQDVGDGMPYLEILREVVSYGDSYLDENSHLNDEAIKKRGERLGHAVWETLAEDWLGWTDG